MAIWVDIKQAIKDQLATRTMNAARDEFGKSKKDDAARQQLDSVVTTAYDQATDEWTAARKVKGVGLFDTFYDNEVTAHATNCIVFCCSPTTF